MTETMRDRKETAISDLRDWAKDNPGEDPGDMIHEIADQGVPVYYHALCELAADDFDLLLTEPEIGPAFDGKPTPINIIAANVYEALCAAMYEAWSEIEEELENATAAKEGE